MQLPQGDTRERVVCEGREYRLRGSQLDVLERVGRFRAVFVADLERDERDRTQLATDLRSLERRGLLDTRMIACLHERERADVVALTPAGRSLLEAHRDPQHGRDQQYYAGWVKQAELWHDAGLYRMSREVEIEVEQAGERVVRVVLDDELKGRAFEALHRARRASERHADPHEEIAILQGLTLQDGHFVFPDVRLEIEDAAGNIRTLDLELVTRHYHAGHVAGKARAGFRLFSAGSKRGSAPYADADYLTDTR